MRLFPVPVDQTKKRRCMVNLDKALAMLVDETAAVERRSTAQFLINCIEDSIRKIDDDKFRAIASRLEKKIEMLEGEEQAIVKAQWIALNEKWADLQYMDDLN